jgi:signal transduction histidine kinase
MRRIVNTIDTELFSLVEFTRDWAHWDDTYKFVQDRNSDYIEANLGTDTQVLNRMDFILYINTEGEIVWGKAVSIAEATEIPFAQDILDLVTNRPSVWSFDSDDVEVHSQGITLVKGQPILVAGYPILTSIFEGPRAGSMLQGRYLTPELIQELGDKVAIPFSFHLISDKGTPPELLERLLTSKAEQPTEIENLDEQYLAGYSLIKGLDGEPVGVIRAVINRAIYQQGQISMLYLAISTLLAGLIFGGLMIVLLDREVLSRLAMLSNHVKRIGSNYTLTQRVNVTGRDELSSLGNSINEMLQTIEESQEKLERFVYIISHDLRSPLTALRSYVYLMKTELTEKNLSRLIEDLQSTERVTNNMHEMVERLLTLSRLKKENYAKESVDLNKILATVRENLQILLIEKGINLTFAPNMPTLNAYLQPLQEVFSNLISNALKFTQDVTNPMIEVGFLDKGSMYQFFVRDNGVGIPEANKEKLFSLFFHQGKHSGAGIGLTIVKEYVGLHGGEVWVDSSPGKGTTFWFTIQK